MHTIRVIPVLLLKGKGLVKTKRFKSPKYVGDPINAVKIFNDKEVDELVFLDITASVENREPRFDFIEAIASEAFMPFAYGGGVNKIQHFEKLFKLGVEKVIVNTALNKEPSLVKQASSIFGAQSVVASIDVKKSILGKQAPRILCGSQKVKQTVVEYAKYAESLGVGEIMINSIDRDGMMQGYDLELIKSVSSEVDVPVIACGGAGNLRHLEEGKKQGMADAVAAGSMFVFNGLHRAVLINYPKYSALKNIFQ